jgi:glycyl-tRNA synthetase
MTQRAPELAAARTAPRPPYCLTVDSQTAEDETVTIRYRDSREQRRIKVADALSAVQQALAEG